MRSRSLCRLLPLTIALTLSSTLLLRASSDDLLFARLNEYLNALRVQAGIPALAAAVVGPGEVVWEQVYGLQDIDRNIAARYDTPFELDGTTEAIVGSLALRCASDGWLSLDDPVGAFVADSPDAALTLRQLLMHTVPGPNGPVFSYQPERLGPIANAVAGCTDSSFRFGIAGLFARMAMINSVPGADVVKLAPHADGFTVDDISHFSDVLSHLATPYAVDGRGRATASEYTASTLTPWSGMVSTLQDLEQFDLALKKGVLLRPEWLALAWTPPIGADGERLPHGIGWFVQTYNNERVVWQFGVSDSASSSLLISIPGRGLTLILLANSQGLVRPYPLAEGNVAVSPFARVFLSLFMR
jgi:CubicO group peptidase (beta-lactamase class C family)